eukprot:NODE_4739_length_1853_cov_4.805910.p1 GENE.NODE_4739_length_1853_cov_4.805910~~NODE_4739_length_1853_cov_4.805910.p1  ORF type:complete len:536 (-),score=65.02 NODE_4739_length_1853_cov_4.805910:115-1722(-)
MVFAMFPGRPHMGTPSPLHCIERVGRERLSGLGLRRCGTRSDSKAGPSIIALPLSTRRLTFGRGQDCNVKLKRAHVSNLHANLEMQLSHHGGSRLLIEDTSSNGTWVNGERLSRNSPAEVRPGDRVSFLPAAHDCYPDALMYEVCSLRDRITGRNHRGFPHVGAGARTDSASSVVSGPSMSDGTSPEGTQHSPRIGGGESQCSLSSGASGQSSSKRKQTQELGPSRKRMPPVQSYFGKADVCDTEEAMHCHGGGARVPWLTEGGADDFPRASISASHFCRSAGSRPLPAGDDDHSPTAIAFFDTLKVDAITPAHDGPELVPSAACCSRRDGAAMPRGTPSRSRSTWRKHMHIRGPRHARCCKTQRVPLVLHTMKLSAEVPPNFETPRVAQPAEPRGVEEGEGEPRDVSGTLSAVEDPAVCTVKDEPAEVEAAGTQSPLIGPAIPPIRGVYSMPLGASQGGVSAWLRSIGNGSLQAQYERALLQLFDNVSQIATLYESRPEDFFEDVGVNDAAHKTSFVVAIDILCQQRGLAIGSI